MCHLCSAAEKPAEQLDPGTISPLDKSPSPCKDIGNPRTALDLHPQNSTYDFGTRDTGKYRSCSPGVKSGFKTLTLTLIANPNRTRWHETGKTEG
jgi:hypothetical protein